MTTQRQDSDLRVQNAIEALVQAHNVNSEHIPDFVDYALNRYDLPPRLEVLKSEKGVSEVIAAIKRSKEGALRNMFR